MCLLGVFQVLCFELMDGLQVVFLIDQDGNIVGMFVLMCGVDIEQCVFQVLFDCYGKFVQEGKVLFKFKFGKMVDLFCVCWVGYQIIIMMYVIFEELQNGMVEFFWVLCVGVVMDQMCVEVDLNVFKLVFVFGVVVLVFFVMVKFFVGKLVFKQ